MTTPKASIISAIATLLLSVSCQVQEPVTRPAVPGGGVLKEIPAGGFVPGLVSVQLDDATTAKVEQALAEGEPVATRAPGLGGIFAELGVKSMRRVFPYAGQWEERTRREGLHRFYYLEFSDEMPVTKAAADLESIKGIVSVSPQFRIQPRVFNDPYFSSQWHYVNQRYSGADINVQKVWDEFTVGSPNVIVSVVDEGVNMSHEDLVDNLIPCKDDGTGSYNFNNDTPNVVPTQGHGSHVAGIVAAVSNNGKGVAGVAGGDYANGKPGVKVMSCQIFDLYGNQPDTFAAIKHGADNGAVILQCSWGFSPDMDGDGFTTDQEIALYCSYTIDDLPEYKAAIDYFIKYAGCDNKGNQLPDSPMKGGVAIFASGNDNFYYDPLVSYEPIIAVGAFGATGKKASYSNYGNWIDVAAPGGDAKQGIYSTLLGNAYGGADWQGTSMACPHVSGVAALLVSYFGGPGFTADECRTRIVRGAVPGYFTGSSPIGRKLDAYGAFTYDMNTKPVSPVMSWTGSVPASFNHNGKASIPFTVTDPLCLDVKVSLEKEIGGVSISFDYDSGYSLDIDADAMKPGKYNAKIVCVNEDRMTASLEAAFEVLANVAPELADGGNSPLSCILDKPGDVKSLDLNSLIVDADGDPLNFSASLLSSSDVLSIELGDNGLLTLTALKSGSAKLSVKASDGSAETAFQLNVAVKNQTHPVFLQESQVSDFLQVHLDGNESVPTGFFIYNSAGALLIEKWQPADIFNPVILDIQKLAPGVYTLEIKKDKSIVSRLRFVKL